MLNFNLPSVVLREAWSITPLDTIHDVVFETIVELGRLVDAEDEARRSTGEDLSSANARRMALRLCTIELMDEAGLDSDAKALPPVSTEPGLSWGLQYVEALERYRTRAAKSLGTALGVGPRTRNKGA